MSRSRSEEGEADNIIVVSCRTSNKAFALKESTPNKKMGMCPNLASHVGNKLRLKNTVIWLLFVCLLISGWKLQCFSSDRSYKNTTSTCAICHPLNNKYEHCYHGFTEMQSFWRVSFFIGTSGFLYDKYDGIVHIMKTLGFRENRLSCMHFIYHFPPPREEKWPRSFSGKQKISRITL